MNIERRGFGSQLTNFDVLTYDGLADPACCEKYLKDNKHDSLNLALKICSDICPWTLSVPRSEQFSESEALSAADKYPSIFSRQMKAIVYICQKFL